jgi:predicted nuclease with TOPRIM domain
LKEDCPEQIVACDFHYIGCSVRIERKRMQQHLNEGIAQHLTLLLGDYMNVKEQLKCVTEELEKTKEENVRLREDQQALSDELHQRRQVPTNYQQNQF